MGLYLQFVQDKSHTGQNILRFAITCQTRRCFLRSLGRSAGESVKLDVIAYIDRFHTCFAAGVQSAL